MKVVGHNKASFINRKEELSYLQEWIYEDPKNILFLTGPKSSGKTTLLYKLIEMYMSDGKYDIKHFNLRKIFIGNYKDFLKTFFELDYSKSKDDVKEKREYDLKVFKLTVEMLKGLENKEFDPFVVMEDEMKKLRQKGIRPVIIIDELQALEGIYMNGQRELLKELFNFFVAMTKESQLCHVIIASSDGFFIERIYNDSKLKKTSDFLNVDYLKKEDVYFWLKDLKEHSNIVKYTLSDAQKDKIWDTFGGSCWEISRFLGDIHMRAQDGEVKDQDFDAIIKKRLIASRSLFVDYAALKKDRKFLVRCIHQVHKDKGYFEKEDLNAVVEEGHYSDDGLFEMLGFLVQNNFIAYNPATAQYTLQGRSMELGLEMYVDS